MGTAFDMNKYSTKPTGKRGAAETPPQLYDPNAKVLCGWCTELIHVDARVCIHCHAYLHKNTWRPLHKDVQSIRDHLRSIAAVMTIVFVLWLLAAVLIFAGSVSTSGRSTPTTRFCSISDPTC